MAIIGFGFNSISAERKDMVKGGEIKVNSTPKITSISEIAVPNMSKKALRVEFEFRTTYEPNIGEIKVGGNIIYLSESNQKVLKQWKEKKSLPEEASVEILNHLFRVCLLRISHLAEDIQLPPPIQFPKVKPKGSDAG